MLNSKYVFKEKQTGRWAGLTFPPGKEHEGPNHADKKGGKDKFFTSVLIPPFKCVKECALLGFLLLDFKFHCSYDVTFALAFPALPFNNHEQHILPALQFGELKESSLVG